MTPQNQKNRKIEISRKVVGTDGETGPATVGIGRKMDTVQDAVRQSIESMNRFDNGTASTFEWQVQKR